MNDPLLGALRLEMRPISTYLLLLLLMACVVFVNKKFICISITKKHSNKILIPKYSCSLAIST